MELIHTINGVVISEPIGFDNMKATIKRHEYHGMSAEVSVGELEFYGVAANMIKAAYNTDLDTELTYQVKTETGEELYSGVVDLATYSELNGAYFSVSCKVGEVGIKTTFNNRTDTYVDLNKLETIDGEPLANNARWEKITIPHKTLVYTNEQKQTRQTTYTEEPGTGNTIQLPDDFGRAWLNISLDTTTKSEFGEVQPLFHLAEINAKENTCGGYVDPFCSVNTGETIDNESDIHIEVNLECSMHIPEGPGQINKPFTNITANGEGAIRVIAALRINGYQLKYSDVAQKITNDDYAIAKDYTLSWSGVIKKKDLSSIYLGIDFYNLNCRNEEAENPKYFNNSVPLRITINKGSYIRATLYSEAKYDVSADMMMVHDALDTIVSSVSNNKLRLQSKLYKIIAGGPGDGALKAITNGYKIRGLKPIENKERNMSVSFKDMIESLNSIDCIGWGFEKDSIRVEKWDWFYQNDKLLYINNPKEITRKIDESMVITELTIGYKKYATEEDFASIDSVHGERVFNTTTSAITKQVSSLCEFIADNYAIESTRRKALTEDEEGEFKYDENIFIFALQMEDQDEAAIYTIPNDIESESSGSVRYPEQMYNSIISPTRNAYRWINRIFCLNGIKPFILTKGTINYIADFKTLQSSGNIFLLKDDMNNIPLLGVMGEEDSYQESQSGEDMSLQEIYYAHNIEQEDGTLVPQPSAKDWSIPRMIRAEEISLTYPVSIDEYKTIIANPYGLVVVDGEECWIKEFQYDFNASEADFKLIPKAK